MYNVGNISIDTPLILAPMEDVTDKAFRILCREYGADIVVTEFVNSDGLTRSCKKADKKMNFNEKERPVAIQIYGHLLDSMVEAAKLAEKKNPDFIDINAGCWVKKVSGRGAGAALMKDPEYLQKMAAEIIKAVDLPVTLKTRLGWDMENINILEIAQRLEDVGISAITIHARTRSQGHSGEPMWEKVIQVKEKVSIPIILNGSINSPEDAKRALDLTGVDGLMIGRGAIGAPWLFKEIKEYLQTGSVKTTPSLNEKINVCLRHLKLHLELKEGLSGIRSFRKFYAGYIKGLHGAAKLRNELMQAEEFSQVQDLLLQFGRQFSE